MLGAKQKHIGSLHEDKGLTHLEIECTASLCPQGRRAGMKVEVCGEKTLSSSRWLNTNASNNAIHNNVSVMCAYTWLHVWYDCFIHICALMCVLICWCTYAKHNTCMLTCICRRLRCAHVCTATLVGIILSVWLLFLSFVFVSIRWSGYVLFSKCVVFHSSSVFHSLYD